MTVRPVCLMLLVALSSSAAAQEILIRSVVRPPPVTLEGLKLLQGTPPTGPCSLPSPQPALVPAQHVELPDTSRLELAAGWRQRPLVEVNQGLIDVRLEAPDGAAVHLLRKRNGAHGRTFWVYRNGENAKGTTCTVQADSVGAIWNLYEPDPSAPPSIRRRYGAFGEVVTPAGRWYGVTVWSTSISDRDRAASTITALLLRQRSEPRGDSTIPTPASTQFAPDTPAGVATAYFAALAERQWGLAADLVNLTEFEAYLRNQITNLRRPQRVRTITVEQYMKSDSAMPREVAEYLVSRININARQTDPAEFFLTQFAEVDSVDQVARLTPYAAMARWLQAKDPFYHLSRGLKQAGCDSTVVARLVAEWYPKLRVFGAVQSSPTRAYAVFGPESMRAYARPNLLELRLGSQGWRVYWTPLLENYSEGGLGGFSCPRATPPP
jgi:hypothetical protein